MLEIGYALYDEVPDSAPSGIVWSQHTYFENGAQYEKEVIW